jgi:oxygen-independent coproporphyrinogen-3 oxidase
MAFGIYVHIPYCIQRCSYCDFATYEHTQILPASEYITLVLKEIRLYGHLLRGRQVDTLYFGGGTPSLLDPKLLQMIVEAIKDEGFAFSPSIEITIEINPATITQEKLDQYLAIGINRFSVGAQTFHDEILKQIGREHDTQDTIDTLEMLASHRVNYTFDILFALPSQTLRQLDEDIDFVSKFSPSHISAYCLTVPDSHPLAKSRLIEEDQLQMFELIRRRLFEKGFLQYEISNFAKKGFESQHNLLYWTDQIYWGLGLSAHSYTQFNKWGERFWNSSNIKNYEKNIKQIKEGPLDSILQCRAIGDFEIIEEHQSLTDFCHTSLRTMVGLRRSELERKFGAISLQLVENNLEILYKQKLIKNDSECWSLTEKGILVSNQVFSKLTFLEDDLEK